MFRFTTAGESHGRGLVAVLEGIPAGLPLSAERVNVELKRRMGGYGRGARMKIEADQIEWLAGGRARQTARPPPPVLVWERDWGRPQARQAPARGRLNQAGDASSVRCLDAAAETEMIARIDAAKAAGDTLGGVVEVIALGLPVGLGSHVSWDAKLDGRLAQALMSIPAVKGVALGLGFEAARRRGSEVHDEILPGLSRATNRAGGTEGGMTTGEPLVARVAMKPISTLMSPLRTVDLKTGGPAAAQSERSDVTAVPAMGVIAEAMLSLVLAQALLEKFGGDALSETKRNFEGYVAQVRARTPTASPVPPLRMAETGAGGEAGSGTAG